MLYVILTGLCVMSQGSDSNSYFAGAEVCASGDLGGCPPLARQSLLQKGDVKTRAVQADEETSVNQLHHRFHSVGDARPMLTEIQDGSEIGQQGIPPSFYGYSARRVTSTHADVSLFESGPSANTSVSPLLVPPSKEPYNFDQFYDDFSYSQWGQDRLVGPVLSKIKNGFFVESGARDGEEHSNTVFFEKRGWTGLLIEPSQVEFPKLQAKHRKAFSFHGCLSPTTQAETLHFTDSGDGLSHINTTSAFVTLAFPLASMLEPLNRSVVDFWSLDVEGSEGPILESTDFSKIEVGVIMIEMNKGEENNRRIRAVMEKAGFQDIGTSLYYNGSAVLDHIYGNPKYFQKRGLTMPSHIRPLAVPVAVAVNALQ